MTGKTKKRIMFFLISIIAVVAVAIIGFYIYTLDYYRASEDVAVLLSETNLTVETEGRLTTIYANPDQDTGDGIIFYPGGKVEAIAYTPLLLQLAEEGYTCVLIKMPMNLAVFDVKAADQVFDKVKNINHWYLAGHSLGGAMASSYVKENYKKVDGLMLFGAYPLNEAPVETLAIYGTYDLMLDLEKVRLSDEVVEIVDGNHAYFGNYGEQEGDGKALITREEQQQQAVDAILAFLDK